MAGQIYECPEWRDRLAVFGGRLEAGEILADMLQAYAGSRALVLAIPAGGVPVGRALADSLDLELDVAVVSKITPPDNSEIGYGAVAFDGTVQLNDDLIRALHLDDEEVHRGITRTRAKVERRVRGLRGDEGLPTVRNRPVLLVDDGLASGYTMRVAVEVLAARHAHPVIVAVPTAPLRTLRDVAGLADAVYCANVRTSTPFAVADAYVHWYDVSEAEARNLWRSELLEPSVAESDARESLHR
jgi:predicted phosphoribosyltransferase